MPLTVYLLPVSGDRFELYSELPEDAGPLPDSRAGRLRRWAHRASVRWRELVDKARRSGPRGRLAQWRDAVVRRLAESLAEQRTLWALRHETEVTLCYPSSLSEATAREGLNRLLTDARRHHGWWLIIDLVLFVASGVLFFVPGPNILAYYLAFRVFGHLNSWRGARHGAECTTWRLHPDADLAELARLVGTPRETRAPLVAEIAARLNLPRLVAFFDRVAA